MNVCALGAGELLLAVVAFAGRWRCGRPGPELGTDLGLCEEAPALHVLHDPVGQVGRRLALVPPNLGIEAGGHSRSVANGDRLDDDLVLITMRCAHVSEATALLLSIAAVVGYFLLQDAPASLLAAVRSFAGGAVVASLAIEVFPKAYREDHQFARTATPLGVVTALALGHLA